jgi:hypothetical protein
VSGRDIGWISLFGGAGTLLGAAVTASSSSSTRPAPILAGLAVGPVVGMIAGGILWPRLRGVSDEPPSPAAAPVTEGYGSSRNPLAQAFRVTHWEPLMGAMPAPGGSGETSLVVGVHGKLW